MKTTTAFLLFVFAFTATTSYAQEAFFEFSTMEEAFDAAKESDKLVLIYYFDEEAGSANAYDHLWSDPLVARFVDQLAVTAVISSDSEAGEAFAKSKRRGRRHDEAKAPGIYFFSENGRSLGVLRGALDGQEGVGQMMMMLGAADYASKETHDRRRRRFVRYH